MGSDETVPSNPSSWTFSNPLNPNGERKVSVSKIFSDSHCTSSIHVAFVEDFCLAYEDEDKSQRSFFCDAGVTTLKYTDKTCSTSAPDLTEISPWCNCVYDETARAYGMAIGWKTMTCDDNTGSMVCTASAGTSGPECGTSTKQGQSSTSMTSSKVSLLAMPLIILLDAKSP